ncbi:MAG: OB-fold nucleic acid binding domain-containing protein [Candidatus Bathyarchaeia archaeon]|nr:hypothetical protein [Candidatus Bathyarchaeota archaeon]
MLLEEVIARILSARPELTRDEVLRMIEARERSARGFLTRESAALSLAAELGIPIQFSFKPEMQIKNLVSGLNDVTVTGRVIYVSPLRRFMRRDGGEGSKRSIYIADKTGRVKVNLWNEKAESPNWNTLVDKIVRLSHVSVRRGPSGRVELNVDLRSEIEIEPSDLRPDDYPPLANFIRRIGEIKGDERIVDVAGILERIHPITIFRRQDGGEGRVRRAELSDQTGRVTLVLWDEHADMISEEHLGKYIMLINLGVRRRFDGQLELHSRSRTKIMPLHGKPSGF